MLVCPACKIEYAKGKKYCAECGASLLRLMLDIDEASVAKSEREQDGANVVMVCSKCGASHKTVVKFCSYCGINLSGATNVEPLETKIQEAEKTVKAMVQCSYCYTENEPGAVSCKNCGIDLIETPAETTEPVSVKQETIEEKISPRRAEQETAKSKADLITYESMKLDDTGEF